MSAERSSEPAPWRLLVPFPRGKGTRRRGGETSPELKKSSLVSSPHPPQWRTGAPIPIPSGLRPSPLDKGSRPLDPILRGPPMREAGNHRKGAGGHGIGFRSITAAAERPVTFGWHFSWLKARLLRGLGSSAVQRIGGRPSVPPLRLKQTGSVGSAKPGADLEAKQGQILRPQGPSGPGGNLDQPLRFCAPEIFCPAKGITPVNGVQGRRI